MAKGLDRKYKYLSKTIKHSYLTYNVSAKVASKFKCVALHPYFTDTNSSITSLMYIDDG